MTDIDHEIDEILQRVTTIALVGASNKPHRDSYRVMQYLQKAGYRVIPVNPRLAGQALLGETVMPDLASVEPAIDMIDIFRRSEAVPAIVEEALHTSASVIWMQLGVIHQDAAAKARAAGRQVIMDRCPKIELERRGR